MAGGHDAHSAPDAWAAVAFIDRDHAAFGLILGLGPGHDLSSAISSGRDSQARSAIGMWSGCPSSKDTLEPDRVDETRVPHRKQTTVM